MKIADLGEAALLRVPFSKMRLAGVPRSSGIYVLASYFDSILYVGVSCNLQRRMLSHLNNETKLAHTPLGKAYWFFFKICSAEEFRPYERGWLLQHQLQEGKLPHFNKIEAPC